jgi:hypothetical protein
MLNKLEYLLYDKWYKMPLEKFQELSKFIRETQDIWYRIDTYFELDSVNLRIKKVSYKAKMGGLI